MDLCSVCHKNPFKYKCSICVATSCSLQCYKQHKESNSCETTKRAAPAPVMHEAASLVDSGSVNASRTKKKRHKKEQSDPPLHAETLVLLLELPMVKSLLGSDVAGVGKGETDVIRRVLGALMDKQGNVAEQRERLETYLLNCPEFATFCDVVLKKVGVRDQQGYYCPSGV